MNNAYKPMVLMIGPARNVRGGISTVVNSYLNMGIGNICNLSYLDTMVDGNKLKKLFVAVLAYIKFCLIVGKYDIVHIHMAAQASFIRKSLFINKAYKKKKKIIIHQHAADFDDFFLKQSDRKKQIKIRNTFYKADKVIVLSEEWASFFAKYICNINKITILHNGVIIPSFIRKDYNDHNILFLGRLGKRKGSYDILEAATHIIKEITDVKFYFGGDGDIEQSIKIIEEKNLKKHVKLLGWVNDDEKEIYLKRCSVFILPSYHEGMPMSVLEAMSYGCATISTNVGGIPQIIENGVNGIRIEAGDINGLKNNIIELLNNVEFKRNIGVNARDSVKKKFNVIYNIEILRNMYKEMISKNIIVRR